MSDLLDPRALIPLEQAVEFPQLGGLFSLRDLRRYSDPRRKLPLPTVRPGREYLTTAEWVETWIGDLKTCRDPARLLIFDSGQSKKDD